MGKEVWYCWKELAQVEEEDELRLITPRADPHMWEYPFDFVWWTAHEAQQGLSDFGVPKKESDEWVMVKVTLEPLW